MCVGFSSDGRWIATGTVRGIVRLWQAKSGKLVKIMGGSSPPISAVAFSADGRRLAATHVQGTVEVWDTEKHRRISSYPAGSPVLLGLAFHPRSERLIVGRTDQPPLVLPGHSVVTFSLNHDPTGWLLAASGDEKLRPGRARVKVWDLKLGRQSFDVEAFAGDNLLFSVAFSPDGRWLVAGGSRP